MPDDLQIDVLPDDVNTYENRINQAISDFCMIRGIDNLKDEPQNIFTACLMYINRQVFRIDGKVFTNRKSVVDYDDTVLLAQLADVYIYTAVSFNKTVSYTDFCRMLGIDLQSVNNWKRDSMISELSRKKFEIMKSITLVREETLANLLTDGKNRVGVIAMLNRQFGWSSPFVASNDNAPRLSRNDMLQGIANLPEKSDPAALPAANEDTF